MKTDKARVPAWIDSFSKAMATVCGMERVPDYILINEYCPGQGIFPHQDGPLFRPLVATVSLGAPCLLKFYPHVGSGEVSGPRREAFSLVLQPRSLVVFAERAYTHFLHGIGESTHEAIPSDHKVVNLAKAGVSVGEVLDRSQSTRVSVTFRAYADGSEGTDSSS